MSGDDDNNAPITKAEFIEVLMTLNVVKEQTKEMKCDLSVSEYEEDKLADGSGNEKCLYQAELRAGKKTEAWKAAKRKKEQLPWRES